MKNSTIPHYADFSWNWQQETYASRTNFTGMSALNLADWIFFKILKFRQLKEFRSRTTEIIPVRYELMYQGLFYLFSNAMVNEINQEVFIVDKIDEIAQKIKKTKDMVSIRWTKVFFRFPTTMTIHFSRCL